MPARLLTSGTSFNSGVPGVIGLLGVAFGMITSGVAVPAAAPFAVVRAGETVTGGRSPIGPRIVTRIGFVCRLRLSAWKFGNVMDSLTGCPFNNASSSNNFFGSGWANSPCKSRSRSRSTVTTLRKCSLPQCSTK